MAFLDSSVPITTCEASDCEGCPVADSLHCHFRGLYVLLNTAFYVTLKGYQTTGELL